MKILIVILSFLALQTSTYSSTSANNKFNQKYLSNYFSALVSSGNQKNEEALEYFNSSKFLIQKHDNFLKKYVFSLVLNGQVKKGIDQIKISKNDINSNTFAINTNDRKMFSPAAIVLNKAILAKWSCPQCSMSSPFIANSPCSPHRISHKNYR